MDSPDIVPAPLTGVLAPVAERAPDSTGGQQRTGRRGFLRSVAGVGLLGSIAGCDAPRETDATTPTATSTQPSIATPTPTETAQPAAADRPAREDATHVVNRASELFEAVTEEDALVWVPGRTKIDCGGAVDQWIAPGVTVASDRDPIDGRAGGRIVADGTGRGVHLFRTYSPDVRITGLRLTGPDDSWLKQYDPALTRTFALFMGADCEFDHNEISGRPFAGVALGSPNRAPTHDVHHTHFHDNLMEQLGYGVELYRWNKASASGLAPEGEADTPITQASVPHGTVAT